MNSEKKRKVLLIGWDAADWKVINPLMDGGLMPNLEKLVNGGASGKIATLDPPLSPTLWTSIATGVRPYKHGILGFTEADPSGKGIRPIYHTKRKVKAVWNILTQHKLKTHVVGWWPSHPAEPINGVMISDFYHKSTGKFTEQWPMKEGTVHPKSLEETFAKLRIHPEELTASHILPFVPNARKIDQKSDQRLTGLRKITAQCATIHSAFTYTLDHEEWDFAAVYFDSIDHYSHGFMKFHPPKQEQISQQDFDMYQDVVTGGYRFHDMMLGQLMEQAGEDTTIILVSDHGFHPDHNRPKVIPKEPSGPALEHSPYGIVVINGPGIKKDELIFGASILDVTPTILTLFGLPVAEDMDGKTLISAFVDPPEIDTIKSWENIKGADGRLTEELNISLEEMEAELKQLVDLGYIQDPGDDAEIAIKNTEDENNFYLARCYFDGGEWEKGIAILEKLYNENPDTLRYASRLAHGYMITGQYKKSRKVVDYVKEILDSEHPSLEILEASLLFAEERYKGALELLMKVEREAGTNPDLSFRIANTYLQLGKFEQAEPLILKALEEDNENINGWYTLGLCYYDQAKYDLAVNAFLDSIGLQYYFPQAHYYLGMALYEMEKYEDAAAAFDITLRIAPAIDEARLKIITIYEQHLEQPGKAVKYKTDSENRIKGEMVLVSGLPRSGTSMMMQMLEAGGLDIFTDKLRLADQSNPKGYYEHEAVKNTAINKTWVPKAKNKGVKVIAQLLEHMPSNFRYKVIFMNRDLGEVLQSQATMLGRKKNINDAYPMHLHESYLKALDDVKLWQDKHPNVEVLYVNYKDVIEKPMLASMHINDFLEGNLNPEKMTKIVDASMYKERKEVQHS
tara:strand:+ start:942 stop:3503 length:2562 start_codon:yes stop_codon:yes gene_type:complete